METNLLLLDSFKNIESMVAYAFSFSHRTNRPLKIIYVYDFDISQQLHRIGSTAEAHPMPIDVHSTAKQDFENANIRLKDVTGHYLEKHSVDVPFEIIISDEKRLTVLDREINTYDSVILLIGDSRGYSDVTGGQSYPNLIDSLRCPILIIPENTSEAIGKNLLYATNFHPDDITTLKQIKKLFNASDLKVVLLHNEENKKQEVDFKLKGLMERINNETQFQSISTVQLNEQNLLDALILYIKEHSTDLVVLLKEKKGLFKEFFKTSNTRNTITHLNKPVLVYYEV